MKAHPNHALDISHIRSLLSAIDTRQHIQIMTEHSTESAHTVILGADFERGELLLAEPHPKIERFHHHERIWVKQKAGEEYLSIEAKVVNQAAGLTTISMLNASWNDNKRWHNRIQFTDLNGPKVRINREFSSNLEAVVSDISLMGLAIDIWGKELNREFTRGLRIDPAIRFNEDFHLNVNAQVLGAKFIRTPSCHTRIRLRFDIMSTVERSQLEHFIISAGSNLSFAA